MQIARKLFGVSIDFDQNRLVTALEQMTGPGAFDVKISGIGAVDVMHDLGQIGPGGLQQQVIVVVHQTVRMHPRIVALTG